MKLQAFGELLAEEHRRALGDLASLESTLADLDSLRRKPHEGGTSAVARVSDVLGVARTLVGATELLDLLPSWFPSGDAVGHRVLRDQLPVLVRVADRSVVLIASSPGSGLLVRSGLGPGMAQLFDLLWERATSPVRHQILQLMAAGLDDAAVARATGKSIRTVRAHVGAIMTELGVDTRLAAGVAAVRRGWL